MSCENPKVALFPELTNHEKAELQAALAKMKEWGTEYLRFEQPDVHGLARGKMIPVRHVAQFAKSGVNMYSGSCYFGPNGGFPPHEDFAARGGPDGFMFPDWSTLKPVPYSKNNLARVLCSFKWEVDGKLEPLPQPRDICLSLLEQLKERHGLEIFSAFEFEFLHLNKDKSAKWDNCNIFSSMRNLATEDFTFKCERYMKEMGVDFNTMNVEYAPGQHEWTVKPAFGIEAADIGFTYKNGLKEIAMKEGDIISFMTKAFPDRGGCSSGGHFNLSLWDAETGRNACYDASKPNGVSDTMRYFTAGLLDHAKALTPFSCPTVNCYLRMGRGTWAPFNTTYGIQNRMTLVRWKAMGNEKGTYMEWRLPSAAQNPYLTLASIVAAGMDGLEKGKANEAFLKKCHCTGNAYAIVDPSMDLPKTLSQGIAALKEDKVIHQAMGETFVKWFEMVKKLEIDALETTRDVCTPGDAPLGGQKDDQAARDLYLEFI